MLRYLGRGGRGGGGGCGGLCGGRLLFEGPLSNSQLSYLNFWTFFKYASCIEWLSIVCTLLFTKVHVIRIVFNDNRNQGKRSLDRISVDRNCVLSLDQNYVNHLIESVDRNFNNVILSYFKLSIKCQNP